MMMSLALEVVIASRRIRSHVLDQTAADVWAYAHSLAGELKADSPLKGAADRALDRFLAAWRQAREDGAGDVHVIAHSLGTVVTYHAMAQRLPPDAIRRLFTIGSPLEKVRFLWTKLFLPRLDWSCEWINVLTPSDPVSGKLKRFDSLSARVQNRRLWGVGGFGEAHVGYFRDGRVDGTARRGARAQDGWTTGQQRVVVADPASRGYRRASGNCGAGVARRGADHCVLLAGDSRDGLADGVTGAAVLRGVGRGGRLVVANRVRLGDARVMADVPDEGRLSAGGGPA